MITRVSMPYFSKEFVEIHCLIEFFCFIDSLFVNLALFLLCNKDSLKEEPKKSVEVIKKKEENTSIIGEKNKQIRL